MNDVEKILILDNIRSVHNVGSIFRTSDAVGITKIILVGLTPGPLDRFDRVRSDMAKVALGAELRVSWKQVDTIDEALRLVQERGCAVVAVEQCDTSVDYKSYQPGAKTALIMGAERGGIDTTVLDRCDAVLDIPMVGMKESLNVSVAMGIVAFRLFDREI